MSGTPPFCSLGSKYISFPDIHNGNEAFWKKPNFSVVNSEFVWNGSGGYNLLGINGWLTDAGTYYYAEGTFRYSGAGSQDTIPQGVNIGLWTNSTDSFYDYGTFSDHSNRWRDCGISFVYWSSIISSAQSISSITLINQTNPETKSKTTSNFVYNTTGKDLIGFGNNMIGASKYGKISRLIVTSPTLPFGVNCQGEIPTFHKEINSSTAKISHSRILREQRTTNEAQRFHDWIKNA